MRRHVNLRAALALALLLSAAPATAAPPSPQLSQTQSFYAFTLVGRLADISVTNVSSNTAFSTLRAPVAVVYNTGSAVAYVQLGTTSVTVTTANGVPVQPGGCAILNAVGMSNIGAITGTTTTLQVALGTGAPGHC